MKRVKVLLFSLTLAAMPLLTLPAPASAQATTITVNERFPISDSLFVGCANQGNGEFVTFSGNLHLLMTFTINGNTVRTTEHWQAQDISGTGDTTGANYQVKGVTHINTTGSYSNGLFEQTADNLRVIGQGPGNNFFWHYTRRIRLDANGEVTVMVDNFRVECR